MPPWRAPIRSTSLAGVPDMPAQALELALAASIYPPAVLAVIALGRGEQLRSRVFVFVLGALLVTYALGVLMLARARRTRRDRP